MKTAFIAFFLLVSLHSFAQENKVTLQLTETSFIGRSMIVSGGNGAMDLYSIKVQLKDNQTASGLVFVEDLTQPVLNGVYGNSETIKIAQQSGIIGVMLKFYLPAQFEEGKTTRIELSGLLAGKMDDLKTAITDGLTNGCQVDVDVNLENGNVLSISPNCGK